MAQSPGRSLGRDIRSRGLAMKLQHAPQALGLKRHATGEKFVKGDGQRIHVAAHAGLIARDLLGRGVVGRAHETAVGRARGRGHAEVRHLDRVGLRTGRDRTQQQVGRLDVPVDHAARVGGGQRPRGLDDVLQRLAPGQRPFALDVLGQRGRLARTPWRSRARLENCRCSRW